MSAIYNVLRGDSNTGMSTMMIHCDGTSDCSELHLCTALIEFDLGTHSVAC